MLVKFFGNGQSIIASTFCLSIFIPYFDSFIPKNSTSSLCSLHLWGRQNRLNSLNLDNTNLLFGMCSSRFLLYVVVSSEFFADISRIGDKTSFIIRWNAAGALLNPNGITLNSKSPYLVLNAVFYSSPGLILNSLYPYRRTNF